MSRDRVRANGLGAIQREPGRPASRGRRASVRARAGLAHLPQGRFLHRRGDPSLGSGPRPAGARPRRRAGDAAGVDLVDQVGGSGRDPLRPPDDVGDRPPLGRAPGRRAAAAPHPGRARAQGTRADPRAPGRPRHAPAGSDSQSRCHLPARPLQSSGLRDPASHRGDRRLRSHQDAARAVRRSRGEDSRHLLGHRYGALPSRGGPHAHSSRARPDP